MATIKEAQARSEQLFTQLHAVQAVGSGASTAPSDPNGHFSWFEPSDAIEASLLAFRFSALSASRTRRSTALTRVLDDAEAQALTNRAEAVRQALAMFVTHNVEGRTLIKPRTISTAPQFFTPTQPTRTGRLPITTGGKSPQLDYWREDPMANEHHGHWHEVYPYMGRPPEDFTVWLEETPDERLVEILEEIAPGQGWAQTIADSSTSEKADLFAQVFTPNNIGAIVGQFRAGQFPAELYWTMFSMNDRHGELFVYMHQQMLARYDAELLSNGLESVEAFAPADWPNAIPEGQTPTGFPPGWEGVFTERGTDQTLPTGSVQRLNQLQAAVDDALATGEVNLRGGPLVPIDHDTLGEFLEGELHNTGHGAISQLAIPGADPRGVMGSTISAIRDQVFWRWHKHIDNLAMQWQATQEPEQFTDAPDVGLRQTLDTTAVEVWESPDIILVRTDDLPADQSPAQLAQLGRTLFATTTWDVDFTSAPAQAGQVALDTVDELVTAMQNSTMTDGRTVRTLTHEAFSYFLRVENQSALEQDVTVRIFLAPATTATDRRSWIEMDKFIATLPASAKTVLYRSDTESSVIKRPAELSPAEITESTASGRERSYCDCGWPYPMLLPRGTETTGMEYRLLVVMTDATVDRMPEAGHCGSMSFCGALDSYPDTREMGYPFARRFDGDPDEGIREAILGWPNAAARTVKIRHVS